MKQDKKSHYIYHIVKSYINQNSKHKYNYYTLNMNSHKNKIIQRKN